MAYPEEVPDSSGELHREWRRLRGCMRDLVAFGGLRALWSGQPNAAVVESFADALLSLVHAEIVLVRLQLTSGAQVMEVLRTADGALPAQRSRRAARRLAPLLAARFPGPPLRVESPLGRGPLFLTVVPLGHETEYGFLAVGSPAPGFPDDLQRALLALATSRGAAPLKERELLELMSRKRAEEAMREGEVRFRVVDADLRRKTELLQTIFDLSPVMISFVGSSGRIEWVNREWERTLGWPLAEARELDLPAALPAPADREEALIFLRDLPSGWRDFRLRAKDGRVVDLAFANVRLSDGRIISFGQDITERKRIEAERERRARQLQGLADAAIGIGAAASVARIAEIVTEAARHVIGVHAAVTRVRRSEASVRPLSARSFSAERSAHELGALQSTARGLHRLGSRSNRPLRRAAGLGGPLTGGGGGQLGSISLLDKHAGEFDADDEAILVQLARLAAEATENARLLEEVTAARERLGGGG